MYSPAWTDTVQMNWISFWVGTYFNPVSGSLLFKYKHVCGKEAGKKEDCLERACWDNLVISKNLKLLHKNARYLLFSLVDPQEKHELRQKHGRCCVWVDAPGVGLEASQAGQHQDSEDERQHGQAQSGVGDQGQGLQISLQLLLTQRRSWAHLWTLEMWLCSSVTDHSPLSGSCPSTRQTSPVSDTDSGHARCSCTRPCSPWPSSILPNQAWRNDKTVDVKPILSTWAITRLSPWNKQCSFCFAFNRLTSLLKSLNAFMSQ